MPKSQSLRERRPARLTKADKKQLKALEKQLRRYERRAKGASSMRDTSGPGCYTGSTASKPVLQEGVEIDAASFGGFATVLIGDTLPADQTILRQKPLTLVVSPKGVIEVRNYANCRLTRMTGEKEAVITVYEKLPFVLYTRIVGLFKEVCKERNNAEALVYIWFRPSDRMFHLVIPPQKVSGASATPDERTFTPPETTPELGAWSLWGHIHSHNTMSAFFSGTDDNSEQEDGLIYGVIGDMKRPCPTVKLRTRVAGTWAELAFARCVDVPAAQTITQIIDEVPVTYKVPIDIATTEIDYPAPPAEWMANIKLNYGSLGRGSHADWDWEAVAAQHGYTGGRHATTIQPRIVHPRKPGVEGLLLGRHKDAYPKAVIRKDGAIYNLWSNGDLAPTGKRVDDLTRDDRQLCLMEGVDYVEASER